VSWPASCAETAFLRKCHSVGSFVCVCKFVYPPPHHQVGHRVNLQVMKILFYATGNSFISLFLSYGKEGL
jgi:hypothetical protein